MQTAAGDDDEVMEGIENGVYWYVTKPFSHKLLLSLVESALKTSRRAKKKSEMAQFYMDGRRKLKSGMEKLRYCKLEFQELKEAQNIANAIACVFPHTANMVTPISEILVNSVEHGNLGISFAEKTELVMSGIWEEEIQYRTSLQENKDKLVNVEVLRDDKYIEVKVKDCGSGFDWQPFLSLDTARAHKVNGRGIYLAGLEFDKIEYQGSGNEVVCHKYLA